MNKYKATLQHDTGIKCFTLWADDKDNAIDRIMNVELCPKRAITKLELVDSIIIK